MTDNTEWGPWIEWTGGDCPIPDLNIGEFDVRLRGVAFRGKWKAADLNWDIDDECGDITHYRLRKPRVDWKAIAEKQNDVLKSVWAFLIKEHYKGEAVCSVAGPTFNAVCVAVAQFEALK